MILVLIEVLQIFLDFLQNLSGEDNSNFNYFIKIIILFEIFLAVIWAVMSIYKDFLTDDDFAKENLEIWCQKFEYFIQFVIIFVCITEILHNSYFRINLAKEEKKILKSAFIDYILKNNMTSKNIRKINDFIDQ